MSTDSLLIPGDVAQHNQPMVDRKRQRLTPAAPPGAFMTQPMPFTAWLRAAVDHSGMPAQLGRWCGASRQNVQKWLVDESVPQRAKIPLIAEWAQVDPVELQKLADKQTEIKQLAPKKAPAPKGFGRPAKRIPLPIRPR